MAELSPAKKIMVAATNGNFNVVNDPVYKQCIAAALRAAADQVASPIPDDCTADVFNRQLEIRHQLLAIAAELEG
jgi:hypothetical protein